MIEAGACAMQIENQVSDEKQCGHQDGKVTVPQEDFLAKIRAIRYAFMDLGGEVGVIMTRTDSLGAGLTKQIAVSKEAGDLGDRYDGLLDCEEVSLDDIAPNDVIMKRDGKLVRLKRLPFNLFQFHEDTGANRCVMDLIASLEAGSALLWIEMKKPHIEQIAAMMDRIRTFQSDSTKRAGIFHHLITLQTCDTEALSTDNLARDRFGDKGMLGYVEGVWRREIRQGIACGKHQSKAGSDLGDAHKDDFAKETALQASGEGNTMNQFA